ncbi:MAG: hypothetical protein R2821_00140 [Flavobacteriaceae bacterium]|nr:DUF4258 domain-containing protein [Flavobacteriaceae bacterium]
MVRRFTLFGFGFILGLGLLFFFLNGKNASCNFMPNERVLDILRNKHRTYSDEVLNIMNEKHIDTTDIDTLLIYGDIDFSKSKTRQEPCRYYWLDGFVEDKKTSLYIENCDTIVTIKEIHITK